MHTLEQLYADLAGIYGDKFKSAPTKLGVLSVVSGHQPDHHSTIVFDVDEETAQFRVELIRHFATMGAEMISEVNQVKTNKSKLVVAEATEALQDDGLARNNGKFTFVRDIAAKRELELPERALAMLDFLDEYADDYGDCKDHSLILKEDKEVRFVNGLIRLGMDRADLIPTYNFLVGGMVGPENLEAAVERMLELVEEDPTLFMLTNALTDGALETFFRLADEEGVSMFPTFAKHVGTKLIEMVAGSSKNDYASRLDEVMSSLGGLDGIHVHEVSEEDLEGKSAIQVAKKIVSDFLKDLPDGAKHTVKVEGPDGEFMSFEEFLRSHGEEGEDGEGQQGDGPGEG